MLVGDKVGYDAVNEAYCLISSYIREEGRVGAKYDRESLLEFVKFLAEILKHPENFIDADRYVGERLSDGSLVNKNVPDHDGSGLA